MKLWKYVIVALFGITCWAAFIIFGVTQNFLLSSFTSGDTPQDFIAQSQKKIEKELDGNLAMVLVDNGNVAASYYDSEDENIDANTVFPVASISKWITSWGIMKLVEEKRIDLDVPVDQYLTRWNLPKGEFDTNKVTIRKLLSHSSGLVDDLGYGGFEHGVGIQTIEESLTKASDAPYSEGVARIGYEPGSQYMYSGAGYTILQLVIEEVTGKSFSIYMQETVLNPLKMTNSTFDLALKSDLKLAKLYDGDGNIEVPKKFTALAAAGLNTTVEDLSKFLVANVTANPVLDLSTLAQMATPETFIQKTGVYGLGPHLYSQNATDSNIIGHDGSGGSIAINTAARIDLISKNGIIVLEMGNYSLASGLADEWLFWNSGIADYVVIMRNKNALIVTFVMGVILIISISIIGYRSAKKKHSTTSKSH